MLGWKQYTNVAAFGANLSPIYRLAGRVVGPGDTQTGTTTTSNGSTVTNSITLVNNSGATMTTVSATWQGWYLTSSGTSNTGNAVTLSAASVEYPVASTPQALLSSGGASITIPDGSFINSDDLTLTTPIPTGGSYKINFTATVPNLSKYVTTNFGFAGLRTKVLPGVGVRGIPYVGGDSLSEVNGNQWITAAGQADIPIYTAAIFGSSLSSYVAAGAMTKQLAMAVNLGCTHYISAYGNNDIANGRSAAQVEADQATIKALVNAAGLIFVVVTISPRAGFTTVTATALTSLGNVATFIVPDATKFVVGQFYAVSGAAQTEYNTTYSISTINTGTNTLTATFIGSVTPTATGTIVITPGSSWGPVDQWSSVELQVPGAFFGAGTGSPLGTYNTDVRAGLVADAYIDWAAATMSSLNSGVWKIGGQSPFLAGPRTITISSAFSAPTFWHYNTPLMTGGDMILGTAIVLTATAPANVGAMLPVSNNFSDIIQLTAPPVNFTAGDVLEVGPGTRWATQDGIHPTATYGSGAGQALFVDADKTYFLTIR